MELILGNGGVGRRTSQVGVSVQGPEPPDGPWGDLVSWDPRLVSALTLGPLPKHTLSGSGLITAPDPDGIVFDQVSQTLMYFTALLVTSVIIHVLCGLWVTIGNLVTHIDA